MAGSSLMTSASRMGDGIRTEGLGFPRLRKIISVDLVHNVVAVEFPSRSGPNWDAVEKLDRLQVLSLVQSDGLRDRDLLHLRGLTQLRELYLLGTGVTDAGLEHLIGLTDLEHLNLEGTDVTDAGLVYLIGLSRLRRLDLTSTSVSDNGIAALKAALPNLVVVK